METNEESASSLSMALEETILRQGLDRNRAGEADHPMAKAALKVAACIRQTEPASGAEVQDHKRGLTAVSFSHALTEQIRAYHEIEARRRQARLQEQLNNAKEATETARAPA